MGNIGVTEILVLGLIALVAIVLVRRFARGLSQDARSEPAARTAQTAAPAPKENDGLVERERVIERQVLVMRCKFCGELTPMDLVSCKSCGANLK
jgi:hypothetical protein